jgi:hypothetical protein
MGMTPRQFYFINLVAILLWAPVQVVPGMLAGNAYRHAGAIARHLTLPIIAGVAGIAFLIWGFGECLSLARWRNLPVRFSAQYIPHAGGRLRKDHARRPRISE